MTRPVRLVNLGPASPVVTQAVYSAIAESMTERDPDTIVFTSPTAPCLSVGFHQDARTVLDIQKTKTAGLPIIRRDLGGGTVYLDEDQWFYQCIFHRSRAPKGVNQLFHQFLTPIVNALRQLGLDAELRAPNEIEVAGKRIAGTGAGQIGDAMVVVGNLLLDFPTHTMADLWRVPSDAFRTLALDGLEGHITTLKRELSPPPSHDVLADLAAAHYARHLNRRVEPGHLTDREIDLLEKTETRLTSQEWLSEHGSLKGNGLKISARAFVREGTARNNDQTLRLTVRVVDGKVEAAILDPPNSSIRELLMTMQADEAISADWSAHVGNGWSLAGLKAVLKQISDI